MSEAVRLGRLLVRRKTNAALGLVMAAWLFTACVAAPPQPSDLLSAEEHNDLGVAHHTRGQYELAAGEFRRALELRPGWSRALVNLGDALVALDDLDPAIAAYEAGRVAKPDDPAIANNLAWALLQHEERWREAEPLIGSALAKNPEPRGYYLDTLGFLLLRKDEPARALEAFRAALADPALRGGGVQALVLRHVAWALARLGDLAGAERCYRQAREVASGTPPRAAGPRPSEQARSEVGESETVC